MENRLPGLYYIETDSTGERTFYYWRNEAAAKFWLESDAAAAICEELATFDYLYLSGISPPSSAPPAGKSCSPCCTNAVPTAEK